MIQDEDVLSVNFLKKQNFTGSYKGMRYILMKEASEEGDRLKVVIWPQPANYETSAPKSRIEAVFPFSKEGRVSAIQWLNDSWEKDKDRWSSAGW